MIHFRIAKHTQNQGDAVEIWRDSVFIGVIYPWRDTGVKVISKHLHSNSLIELDTRSPASVVIEILKEEQAA